MKGCLHSVHCSQFPKSYSLSEHPALLSHTDKTWVGHFREVNFSFSVGLGTRCNCFARLFYASSLVCGCQISRVKIPKSEHRYYNDAFPAWCFAYFLLSVATTRSLYISEAMLTNNLEFAIIIALLLLN